MIKEELHFIEYYSFYKQRYRIKEIYIELNSNDRWIYKYYIYANRRLKETTCDYIWQFLNAIDVNEEENADKKLYDELFRCKIR